jgi:hypothetical protein
LFGGTDNPCHLYFRVAPGIGYNVGCSRDRRALTAVLTFSIALASGARYVSAVSTLEPRHESESA